MSRTITLKMLEEVEACRSQVVLFERLFGDSTPVTEELCVKYASDFNFDFAANEFLTDPAWDEYEKVRGAALAEYEKVSVAALDEYWNVIDAARDEYRKTEEAAWSEYKKTKAITFCRLYNLK